MRTIGVDTGGTFTDLVAFENGELEVAKLRSTPADPARAVLAGLAELRGPRANDHVVHGTTVALNALLTGRVGRTALVTNAGFADLIEIGRQDRPELYALHPIKPTPLVPRERRFEVHSRVWPKHGGKPGELEVVERASKAELRELARRLRAARPDAIAICLLHAYADPSIERELADALKGLGVPLSLSAEILPEHREYERFSTAVVNAALVPIASRYLERLARSVAPARLSIMQSSGGTLPAARAAREPVRVLLSGPAGGVIGAARAARAAGFEHMVGFDMGGTSTDVAFHGGAHRLQSNARQIAGQAIAVPALDIHTIGCGGGSQVELDVGGVLHVGPASAGADPGPCCYGKSDVPTVTDAHVLLGHIASGTFLGGALELDHVAVTRAFTKLGKRMGSSSIDAARTVLEVARAHMRRALAVMTMQRGEDPARVPLVAFGGAGGLHAAALAESLDSPCAIVPRHAGLLSAWGMATATASGERTLTVLAPFSRKLVVELDRARRAFTRELQRELLDDGHGRREIRVEARLDMRYAGQSFELEIPFSRACAEAFQLSHARVFGFRLDDRDLEVVALRVRASAGAPARASRRVPERGAARDARIGTRRTLLGEGASSASVPVFDHARIRPGEHVDGPAIVEDFSGTTLVPSQARARATFGGHLVLEMRRRKRSSRRLLGLQSGALRLT